MAWTCSCGARNKSPFCGKCGQKHIAPEIRPGSESGMNWLITACGVVLLVVCLAFAAFLIAPAAPQASRSLPTTPPAPTNAVPSPSNSAPPSPSEIISTPPAPDQDDNHPAETASTEPAKPALSTDEIQTLISQRQYDLDLIAATNSLLDAPSFAARSEIYCRFTIEQNQSLFDPGISSGTQVEGRYRQLMQDQSPSREEEIKRQYQLRALRQRMSIDETNLQQCQWMVMYGLQKMPTEDQLRDNAAKAHQDVLEIDQKLGNSK